MHVFYLFCRNSPSRTVSPQCIDNSNNETISRLRERHVEITMKHWNNSTEKIVISKFAKKLWGDFFTRKRDKLFFWSKFRLIGTVSSRQINNYNNNTICV